MWSRARSISASPAKAARAAVLDCGDITLRSTIAGFVVTSLLRIGSAGAGGARSRHLGRN
jgi:hypothetical protein